jgi:hypothetical protein
MADRIDRDRRGGQPGDYEDMFRHILEFLNKRPAPGGESAESPSDRDTFDEADDPFWIDFEQIFSNFEAYESRMGLPGLARSRARGMLKALNLDPDDEESIRRLAVFAAMHVLEGREIANEPPPSVIEVDAIHLYRPSVRSASRQKTGDFELRLDDGNIRVTLNLHHCIDVNGLIQLVSQMSTDLVDESKTESRPGAQFEFFFTSHGVEHYRESDGHRHKGSIMFLPAGEDSTPAIVCHLDSRSAQEIVSRLESAGK